MNRTLRRGMGAALTIAVVGLASLPGIASAAAPQADCDADSICVFSQDGNDKLTFPETWGSAIELFREMPGPDGAETWANQAYRVINNSDSPVQLQDVDGGLEIVGTVPVEGDVSVPSVPVNRTDRILLG
jgi:hypothetical protein